MHRVLLLFGICTVAALPTSAQDFTVDWRTKTIACPARISASTPGTLAVRNANTVLYDYQVDVQLVPRAIDDGSFLRDIIGVQTAASINRSPDCNDKLKKAADLFNVVIGKIQKNPFLTPQPKDGKYPSVSYRTHRVPGPSLMPPTPIGSNSRQHTQTSATLG